MAGAVDPTTGLTPQQEAFSQALASGLSQSDASAKAYNWSPDTQRSTITEAASRLSADSNVIARVKQLRDLATTTVLVENAWTLSRMVKQAEKHMEVALVDHPRRGPNVSAANGALEIIGRATGLLSDKQKEQIPLLVTRITVVLDRGVDAEGNRRIVEGETRVLQGGEPPAQEPEPSQASPDTGKAP